MYICSYVLAMCLKLANTLILLQKVVLIDASDDDNDGDEMCGTAFALFRPAEHQSISTRCARLIIDIH